MAILTLIDGQKIAKSIRMSIKKEIDESDIRPGLAVVLVGENSGSQIYVRNKRIVAHKLGMNSFVHTLSIRAHENEVLNTIEMLNHDPQVHGILIQLPLPLHINAPEVIETIDPNKDIDGLHPLNSGRLLLERDGFVPCTPLGCLKMIQSVKQSLSGLNAVVIGRSNLVGKPMSQLLLRENATVTTAHLYTRDLVKHCRDADIIVSAAGSPKLVTAEHVKDGAIIIDVGINRLPDGSICGDVDFEDVTTHRDVHISPVPKGVGPMTIAMLMQNTLKAAQQS